MSSVRDVNMEFVMHKRASNCVVIYADYDRGLAKIYKHVRCRLVWIFCSPDMKYLYKKGGIFRKMLNAIIYGLETFLEYVVVKCN